MAQLRLIFQPVYDGRPEDAFFAYVQPLEPVGKEDVDSSDTDSDESTSTSESSDSDEDDIAYAAEVKSGLFRVKRALEAATGSRKGLVVDLSRIWRPVDVIPSFGNSFPDEWTMDTSVELAEIFLVNPYFEKESFHAILPSVMPL